MLTIQQEITNFSNLLAANLKNNRLSVKSDGVYLELDRLGNDSKAYHTVGSQIANKLYPEILLYKSKIVPSMNRLNNYLKELISNAKVVPTSALYSVVPTVFPFLIEELSKTGYSQAAGEIEPLTNGEGVTLKLPEGASIRSIFMFGNSKYNMYLDEILKGKSDEELGKIYDLYLVNIGSGNNSIRELLVPSVSTTSNANTAILVLAAVDYYLTNKPGELSEDSASVGVLINYQYNLVRVLKTLEELYNNIRAAKKVILYKEGTTAYVDDTLYKEFLNQGGTPDTILGWMLKGTNDNISSMCLTDLLAAKTKHEEDWAKFVELSKLNVTDLLIDKVKTNFVNSFDKIWDEYVPEELKGDLDRSKVEDDFYHFMKEKGNELILKTNTLSRLLMGKVFFKHTNFEKFSEYMVKYLVSDSTIKHQDAATFAVIDMVVLYLTNQLTVGE